VNLIVESTWLHWLMVQICLSWVLLNQINSNQEVF